MEEVKTIYTYAEEGYRTDLIEYEPGVWEVLTYRGEDLINNTGTIDSYPQAEYDFGLHLDLYYQKTLEEVKTPSMTRAELIEQLEALAERAELEKSSYGVLREHLDEISKALAEVEALVKARSTK